MPKKIPILIFVDPERLARAPRTKKRKKSVHMSNGQAQVVPDGLSSHLLCYQGRSCAVPCRSLRKSITVAANEKVPAPSTHVLDLSLYKKHTEQHEQVSQHKKIRTSVASLLGRSYILRLGSLNAPSLHVKSFGKHLVVPKKQQHAIVPERLPKIREEKGRQHLLARAVHDAPTPKPVEPHEWMPTQENTIRDATPWKKKRTQTRGGVTAENTGYVMPAMRMTFARSALAFASVLFVLLLPLYGITFREDYGTVLGESEEALTAVTTGLAHMQTLELQEAAEVFADAAEAFYEADTVLRHAAGSLVTISRFVPGQGSAPASAHNLLTAGTLVSDVLSTITASASLWSEDMFVTDELSPETTGSVLLKSMSALHESLPRLTEAHNALMRVDREDIPTDYRPILEEVRTNLAVLMRHIATLDPYTTWLYNFLGYDEPKRYLVLFQNDAEIRATGGFLGSYALVDIDQGVITVKEMPSQGTYAVEGQLVDFVQAPPPLRLINARWEFQDANWLPDFPTTAKKAAWFYERSGGPTVDGVIALTPQLLEDLLRIIGPLDLTEAYDMTVDENNFREVAQRTYEGMVEDQERPKQILVDIVPAFFEKLAQHDPRNLAVALANAAVAALEQKYLLLFDVDEDQQSLLARFGWTGTMRETSDDYLLVVHSNIGGGKVDRTTSTSHELSLQHMGSSVRHTLSLTRTLPVKNAEDRQILYDYVRVYVPQGATFVSAEGFDTFSSEMFEQPDATWSHDTDLEAHEVIISYDTASGTAIGSSFHKTFFGNWLHISPGDTREATLVYDVPATGLAELTEIHVQQPYTLLWQKQPGMLSRQELVLDPFLTVRTNWRYPETGWSEREGSVRYTAEHSRDRVFGFLFQ